MNEIEFQRLYEAQLTAPTRDERIPAHDRNAAAAMLNVSEQLTGTRLNPSEEYRTWVSPTRAWGTRRASPSSDARYGRRERTGPGA